MKISIITVCYNSAKTIEDTIQSVLSQDYQNIEYIIVDGASKDDTLQIVKKYKDKISHIISELDKGIYDAMNKGIALATGDVIGILNSDDVLADSTILSSIANAFNDKTIDATYGNLVYVQTDNLNKITRTWKSKPYKEGDFLKGWMPPHPTFYAKKSCYGKLGTYNLQLTSAADYELMLRFIHKHKINIAYIPKTLVKMRVGGKSNITLKNRLKANQEDRQAWKINELKPHFYTLFFKPLSKLGQFFA
ncbi:MAG: glycosyltransferase family 2 protein [Bacteroidia bacterium]